MQDKYVLWLVSWYPNRNDKFDGDFVQRHARAAAIHHHVHVLFVTDADIDGPVAEEVNRSTGLTEHIIYFKRKKGWWQKLGKQIRWRQLYEHAIRKIVMEKGAPECIHVHVPWKAGLIALWANKKFGWPFLVTEHWGIYNEVVEDNFGTKPAWMQALLKKIFRRSIAFISVSTFLARGVYERTGKSSGAIIPNVVDTTLFFSAKERYEQISFIHVSNMVPLKNVGKILEAFQSFLQQSGVEANLVLVGNRDQAYVNEAANMGLLNKRIFFLGEVSYREVAAEMQRAHCLVLNSQMENSPCVIGEALCCGLTVIAPQVGGIPELVDESNSILTEAGNDRALVEAMIRMHRDYGKYDREGIASRAQSRFGYPAIASRFKDLYNSLEEGRLRKD